MSDFRPNTRGWWWTLFKARLFSRAVGRKGHCKQITLMSVRSVSAHWAWPCSQCVCFPCLYCLGSRLLSWEPVRPALGCMHFPGLSCSGSGTWVVLRGTDSMGLRFVPFPGLSSSGDEVFGKRGRCNLPSPPFPAARFSGCTTGDLLRQMLTVQKPKKS